MTKTEAKSAQEWDVCLTFQFPAWDETEGLWYRGIFAKSKSEANAYARRQADRDGHLGGGKGRATFTAHATGSAA